MMCRYKDVRRFRKKHPEYIKPLPNFDRFNPSSGSQQPPLPKVRHQKLLGSNCTAVKERRVALEQLNEAVISSKYRITPRDISYNSGKMIGRGTFGYVCEGYYKGSRVAVKVCKYTERKYGSYSAFHDDIRSEADILQLGSDEFFVRFIGLSFVSLDRCLLVMELCEKDLRCHLLESEQVSNAEKYSICDQVLRIFSHLFFSFKIIHGDIKLNNFLVRSCGEGGLKVVLADFGKAHNLFPGDIFRDINRHPRIRQHYSVNDNRLQNVILEWDPRYAHLNYSGPAPDLFSVMYVINHIVFFNTAGGKNYLKIIQTEREVDISSGHLILGDASLAFLKLSSQVIQQTAFPLDIKAYIEDVRSSLRFLS